MLSTQLKKSSASNRSNKQFQINNCRDCGMKFSSPGQLYNHTKKFCINSGFDSLDGLAVYDIKGKFDPYQNISKTNQKQKKKYLNSSQLNNNTNRPPSKGLKSYGQNSLGNIKYYQNNFDDNYADANTLAFDMMQFKKLNEHFDKGYLDGGANNKYKHQLNTNSKVNKNVYTESKVNKFQGPDMEKYQLQRWQKFDLPEQEEKQYISPPTLTIQMKQLNSVLHKSNQSLKNMAPRKKKQYASNKLDELKKIKSMYEQNGGTSKQFKKNVNKMIQFYEKMMDQMNKIQEKSEFGWSDTNKSLSSASRVSTPILKLREQYDENNGNNAENNMKKTNNININKDLGSSIQNSLKKNRSNLKSKRNDQKNLNNTPINPYYPYQQHQYPSYPPFIQSAQQPQIIMLPPYPQQQSNRNNNNSSRSNQNMKMLQKMMELKSEQNKKLMDLLIQSKREKIQAQKTYANKLYIPNEKNQTKNSFQKQDQKINFNYNFERSTVQDLTSQQRLLLALQQQQLDQLKLLSSLPQQLQKIKMQSVSKMAQTRFQMQKQILQQRMKRLQNQQQVQFFEEQRRLMNDQWVSKQRKKLIQKKMKNLLKSYADYYKNGGIINEDQIRDNDQYQQDEQQQYGNNNEINNNKNRNNNNYD